MLEQVLSFMPFWRIAAFFGRLRFGVRAVSQSQHIHQDGRVAQFG